MKLDKHDIAMVNATTPLQEREMLSNVHLKDGILEAASGFMLVQRPADIEDGEKDIEVLIPADILKTIRSGKTKQAILTIGSDNLSVNYINEGGMELDFNPTLTFQPYQPGVNTTYPKTGRLYDDTPIEKEAHIALSVDLLKKLLSILPTDGVLRLGITSPEQPLEFECGNMDRPIRGLLMSTWTNWKDFKWHREPVKEEATNGS